MIRTRGQIERDWIACFHEEDGRQCRKTSVNMSGQKWPRAPWPRRADGELVEARCADHGGNDPANQPVEDVEDES